MSFTKVKLCNLALSLLGVEQVSSLADNTKEAKLCTLAYDFCKQQVITSHKWNFALKRVTLTSYTSTPDYEWSHEFQVPSDCLRVIRHGTDGYTYDFVVEGDKIRSKTSSVSILYLYDVEDVTLFSMPFMTSFIWEMAGFMSYNLISDSKIRKDIMRDAEGKLSRMRVFDAQEGTPEQFFPDTWLDSRDSVDGNPSKSYD